MIFTEPKNAATPLPLFESFEAEQDLCVNGQDFLNIIYNANSFKAITFTCDTRLLENCTHLITAKLVGSIPKENKTKIKLCSNVHTKLYILDTNEIWVGSMNLRNGNMLHELMIRVDKKDSQASALRLYWKSLWTVACSQTH